MNGLFNRHRVTVTGCFDFSHLDPYVLSHLQRVYACLAMGLLSASVGAFIGMCILPLCGLIAGVVSLGLMIHLYRTPDDFSDLRHVIFLSACGLAGSGLVPLVSLTIDMDPSILVNAIIVTLLVTVCFSAVSLLAKTNRWMMFLAGPLTSGLTLLALLNTVNLFVSTPVIELDRTLLLTLFVSSVFIVYDTQRIVEMARLGDVDYILQALDLFSSIVDLLRKVLAQLQRIGMRCCLWDDEKRLLEEE